jgi:hypothetical protein
VPHSFGLVLFLNEVVNWSTDPFTLKAAEFSIFALQTGQHFYNFKVSTYVPTVFFIAYFLQLNLKDLVRFFHVKCVGL